MIPNGFNLVLFGVKCGSFIYEEFDFITRQCSEELSSISALVITGCEGYTDKERTDHIILEFIRAYPALAEFMKKGIHTVQFPDIDKLRPELRSYYEEVSKSDQEYLRQLVYSCNDKQVILGEGTKKVVKDEKCNIL